MRFAKSPQGLKEAQGEVAPCLKENLSIALKSPLFDALSPWGLLNLDYVYSAHTLDLYILYVSDPEMYIARCESGSQTYTNCVVDSALSRCGLSTEKSSIPLHFRACRPRTASRLHSHELEEQPKRLLNERGSKIQTRGAFVQIS